MSVSAWAMMAVLWFFMHLLLLVILLMLMLMLIFMLLVVGVRWYDSCEKHSSEKSEHY